MGYPGYSEYDNPISTCIQSWFQIHTDTVVYTTLGVFLNWNPVHVSLTVHKKKTQFSRRPFMCGVSVSD